MPPTGNLTFAMSSASVEEILDAFADVLRHKLEKGETVKVPHLGTFSVEHERSKVVQENNARKLLPPRDVVVFDSTQH